MKITRISIFKAQAPLKRPFRIALGVTSRADLLFVKIDTDEGISGMGEMAPFHAITGETIQTCAAAAEHLAKLLIGANPLDINGINQSMNRYLANNSGAKCGFDMALHDLAGKALGCPVYTLLGGDNRGLVTDQTIHIDTPQIMADKAVHLKEEGFSAIKIKLGENLEADLARLRKIRESIGPEIRLRVDANQGWDFPTALAALQRMLPYDTEYCEQPLPIWDRDNMKRLREKTMIPIAADESLFNDKDAFDLAANGCCDIFNIKLAKTGGISAALKIDNIAVSAGIPCMIGCMTETRFGLTAAAHVASAHGNIKYLDLDSHAFLAIDPVLGGIKCEGENITLPDTPGLGAELDPDFLKKSESIRLD